MPGPDLSGHLVDWISVTARTASLDRAQLSPTQERLVRVEGWEGLNADVFAFASAGEETKKPLAKRSIQVGGLVLAVLLMALGLKAFAVESFRVPSESMSPTVEIGDRFIVNKLGYKLSDPSMGDIVVFDRPANATVQDDRLVKRIVAVGGQTLEFRSGQLFIDEVVVNEPYLSAGPSTADYGPVTVPEGKYFVAGDNRSRSIDSRVFGPIDRSLIIGQAFGRVWPVDRIGTF